MCEVSLLTNYVPRVSKDFATEASAILGGCITQLPLWASC